jgi:hypothetical protein
MESPTSFTPYGTFSWDRINVGFRRFLPKDNCKFCGAEVFFVRHNGGCVWFDELGQPWPKHECYNDGYSGKWVRATMADHFPGSVFCEFGVVIETEVIEPNKSGRIKIRFHNESIIDELFNTVWDLKALVGSLIIAFSPQDDEKNIKLVKPSADRFAKWREVTVIAKGTKLKHNGRSYVFNGQKWCEYPSYILVPSGLQQELEQMASKYLEQLQ